MTVHGVRGLALAAFLACGHAGTARAAVVTYGPAPTLGGNNIGNLTGATSEAGNIDAGNDDATYVANDRPVVGQTFTTGSNAQGYQLTSFSLQLAPYAQAYVQAGPRTYNVRVTQPSGTSLTVLGAETGTTTGAEPNNFGSGPGQFGEGVGPADAFITFSLAAPVLLQPNAVYGFDVGVTSGYWDTNGTSADAFAGGGAYSSADNGVGDANATLRTGDRVFVASLTPVPEPAALGLLGLTGLGMLARRRRTD